MFLMDLLKLNAMSVGIIGGADGPTAIFVTGPGGGMSTVLLIAGIICLAVALVGFLKKRKK